MSVLGTFIERVLLDRSPVFLHGGASYTRADIAKAIHTASKREDSEFLSVDISLIPSVLVDSVLFGKQSAEFSILGILENIHNLTLFLDGVNLLPFVLQAKLIRVLKIQDSKLNKNQSLDFRVIFGSERTPKELFAEMKFGQSLLYEICDLKFSLDS